MEIIPILSTVLLGVTIITILFAFLSYVAYRVRERKRPVAGSGALGAEPRFFRRYQLPS